MRSSGFSLEFRKISALTENSGFSRNLPDGGEGLTRVEGTGWYWGGWSGSAIGFGGLGWVGGLGVGGKMRLINGYYSYIGSARIGFSGEKSWFFVRTACGMVSGRRGRLARRRGRTGSWPGLRAPLRGFHGVSSAYGRPEVSFAAAPASSSVHRRCPGIDGEPTPRICSLPSS